MLPVAIAGGGPTGLALALMLHQAGIDCSVFDARTAAAGRADRRVLALSHGTRQILERLGAWTEIGATPIAAIHVSQQGSLGRTLIKAGEAGVPALGYVAEAGSLTESLAHACAAAGVSLRHETRLTFIDAGNASIRLRCESAGEDADIQAQLVAWAEGGLGDGAGIIRHDYRQQALVARVRASEPPAGIAYERFTPDGPAALLPLGRRYALVWTLADNATTRLSSLDDAGFLARLKSLFGGRLDFDEVGERNFFPIALRFRGTPVARRAVWLGNAAQTVHPIAGQGFNLALRDAVGLARLLNDAVDCGDAALLARHAAARRADRLGVIGFTDGLVRLFALRGALPAHARGAGLLALDLLPTVRYGLARRLIYGVRAW